MKNTNTGEDNTGSYNSGYGNSGYRNSGDWNSGYRNSGDWNSGYGNSGDWNSGNWNSGYRNSGYLNTTEPKVRIFNKETDTTRGKIKFPDYFWFSLTEWVSESEMTKKEKEENEQYKVTGGYLKVYDYKEAWRKSWDKASDADRRKTLSLPNWDNEIFKEITAIDVEKELNTPKLDDATQEAMELLKKKGFRIVKE